MLVNVNQDTTINEQQIILDELIKCSTEFSAFIRKHIKLDEITLREAN